MTDAGERETLDAGAAPRRDAVHSEALARGEVVGRYVVLGKLGAGAMGTVYAAYDPELDRKVALKLLHAGAHSADERRTRLLREAQALAKLSHPNIVAVHDAGTVGDVVWIAMELVAGKTLREWLDARPRSWREVIAVMTAAGRGLAAAHAAGLVHRDFKPDNVMIDDAPALGRVRVMDFGLARASDDDRAAPPEDVDARPHRRALQEATTQVGTLSGTPAYMAAECFAGARADARADQFSFCVTLWEGLFGARPFTGGGLVELAANVIAGKPDAPPRTAGAPGWLQRIVERGLAPTADERWPSMDALLDALARGQARVRLRRALAIGGAITLIAVAPLGVRELDRRARVAACEAEGAAITEIWNDEARSTVRDALVATGLGFAPATAERVTPWLDRHATAWQNARTEACLSVELRDAWSDDASARALWCLDEARMELAALVGELAHANATVVAGAVNASAGLARPDACLDIRALEHLPPPPIAGQDAVREVRAQLSRAGALRAAGKYAAALEVATAAGERDEALAWPPLHAAAGLMRARLLDDAGAYEEAEHAAAAAYFEAASVDAWDVATAAASQLVAIVGSRQANPTEALVWGQHAEVAVRHAGDPDGLREATRLVAVGTVHRSGGDLTRALELYERALTLREAALGPDHPDVGVSLDQLGVVQLLLGEHTQARALLQRALAISEHALGPDHPYTATVLNDLGNVSYAAGDYPLAREQYGRAVVIYEHAHGPDHPLVATSVANVANVHYATGEFAEARTLLERSLAIRERALEPAHPDIADSLNNLAIVLEAMRERKQARTLYERALAIRERALGPDHPKVAESLGNLATLDEAAGEHQRARAAHERALAILETSLGPDHPSVASTLNNLAVVQRSLGANAEARRLFERALAIWERTLGPDHPMVATCLDNLAGIHLLDHEPSKALPLAERAVGIYDRLGDSLPGGADARATLARALVESGGDRVRARQLAEAARDEYRGFGAAGDGARADVDRWLAELDKGR